MQIIHRNYAEIFPDMPLVDIDLIDYSTTNPRKRFPATDIITLAESINSDGLIQPITLRPKEDGRFEVVAGERRCRAWRHLVKNGHAQYIPAIVRSLDDQQMADIQMAENLARTDLSPIEEAHAYNNYLKAHGHQKVKFLSERFGKTSTHIVRHLRLLRLTKDLQDQIIKGILPVSHALELARLSVEGQTKAWKFVWDGERLSSIAILREFIESNIMIQLDQAPFDPGDDKLYPEAGSCWDCKKQTNSNPVLFSDMKGKDVRCLDRACFAIKIDLHVYEEIERIANEEPDLLILVDDFHPLTPTLVDLVDHYKLPHKYLNSFMEVKSDDEGGREAFVITGPLAGRLITVKETKKSKKTQPIVAQGEALPVGDSPVAIAEESIDDQIADAQAWEKRVQELYEEKVYINLKDHFFKSDADGWLLGKMNETEQLCLFLFLWECIDDKSRDEVKGYLPSYFDDSTPERLFKSLGRLGQRTIGLLFRIAFRERFGSKMPSENGGYFLNLLMRSHISVEQIQSFEQPHRADLDKRLTTVKDRIEKLQRKKERLTVK